MQWVCTEITDGYRGGEKRTCEATRRLIGKCRRWGAYNITDSIESSGTDMDFSVSGAGGMCIGISECFMAPMT